MYLPYSAQWQDYNTQQTNKKSKPLETNLNHSCSFFRKSFQIPPTRRVQKVSSTAALVLPINTDNLFQTFSFMDTFFAEISLKTSKLNFLSKSSKFDTFLTQT